MPLFLLFEPKNAACQDPSFRAPGFPWLRSSLPGVPITRHPCTLSTCLPGHTHELTGSVPGAPRCAPGRCRVPCHRRHVRGALRRLQSDASDVAARRVGDQWHRVRWPYMVRTASAAELASYSSVARGVGRRLGRLRPGGRGKSSSPGHGKPPALRWPRARPLAGRDGATGVCGRASGGCRAHPNAAERVAEDILA